ncbi:MAG TPA: hypothetical protein VFG78_06245 [Gemmatimonadota bacterium]|nr:hypothetical protein [Gemmatimonadota bacterium]
MQVLTITATDYALEAPDTVSAGFSVVRIVNHGEEAHGATLVRLEEDKTLADYLEAYAEANLTRSARPDWARFLGGTLSLIPPRGEGTVTLELEPGNYAWVCFVPGSDGTVHLLGHKQAHGFVVRPRDGDAAPPSAPEPTVSLRMLDFDYRLGAPLKTGRNVIRVVNDGVEPHHVLVFKLDSGSTMEDFHAWLEDLMQGEAPATFVGAMGEMSTGAAGYLEVDLPAGDYVLICLVAGRDEVPHFAKGMIQHIRVE